MRVLTWVVLAIALGAPSIAAEASGLHVRVGGGFRNQVSPTPRPPFPPNLAQPPRQGIVHDHMHHLAPVPGHGPVPGHFGVPRAFIQGPQFVHQHRHVGGHTNVFIVQQPVVAVTAPSSRCLVPGYWTYSWVAMSTTQYLWVPPYTLADGTPVDGYYAAVPATGGYSQPSWIPDRWAC